MSAKKKKDYSGIERRKALRRPVIDTFSIAAVVPKKSPLRLPIHDISDFGMGFDLDTEIEDQADFPAESGDVLEVHLYLNTSLYLPLEVKLIRVLGDKTIRRVGCEFNDLNTKSYEAYKSFLAMLDQLAEAAHIHK